MLYFLFAGETYYPAGGMEDLIGTFPTIDAALARVTTDSGEYEYFDWWHIATVLDDKLVTVYTHRDYAALRGEYQDR